MPILGLNTPLISSTAVSGGMARPVPVKGGSTHKRIRAYKAIRGDRVHPVNQTDFGAGSSWCD